MSENARTLLWEWLGELDDPDPEQRLWKRAYFDGMLLAAERTGLLEPGEIAQWRRLSDGAPPPPPEGADADAAAAHLERLLADVRPLSRAADPDALRAGWRFSGALEALAAAGLVPSDAWHARLLAVEAPWLDEEGRGEIAGMARSGGVIAIGVPAQTPEEEEADAVAAAEFERAGLRGELRRVVAPQAVERHDGLAIVAVVVRSECTEVRFHHVGEPMGDEHGFASLDAHRAAVDALVPPELTDDAGTRYQPVASRPVSARGPGGMPDSGRPRVLTGAWRYQPAAPDVARRFTVGGRWSL